MSNRNKNKGAGIITTPAAILAANQNAPFTIGANGITGTSETTDEAGANEIADELVVNEPTTDELVVNEPTGELVGELETIAAIIETPTDETDELETPTDETDELETPTDETDEQAVKSEFETINAVIAEVNAELVETYGAEIVMAMDLVIEEAGNNFTADYEAGDYELLMQHKSPKMVESAMADVEELEKVRNAVIEPATFIKNVVESGLNFADAIAMFATQFPKLANWGINQTGLNALAAIYPFDDIEANAKKEATDYDAYIKAMSASYMNDAEKTRELGKAEKNKAAADATLKLKRINSSKNYPMVQLLGDVEELRAQLALALNGFVSNFPTLTTDEQAAAIELHGELEFDGSPLANVLKSMYVLNHPRMEWFKEVLGAAPVQQMSINQEKNGGNSSTKIDITNLAKTIEIGYGTTSVLKLQCAYDSKSKIAKGNDTFSNAVKQIVTATATRDFNADGKLTVNAKNAPHYYHIGNNLYQPSFKIAGKQFESIAVLSAETQQKYGGAFGQTVDGAFITGGKNQNTLADIFTSGGCVGAWIKYDGVTVYSK